MSSTTSAHDLDRYGWRPVPRAQSIVLEGVGHGLPIAIKDIAEPTSEIAVNVKQYAKERLSGPTFHHSMRVYYYGQAILKNHFPDWRVDAETYYLTCLLHDIGTTHTNIRDTLLSFEFYGGILALNLLQGEHDAPKAQAEAVAEAIIRHQDLGDTGTITQLGQLLQLATVFDNVGMNPRLVDTKTIESVVAEWPRQHWTACFASTVREEVALKPWSHTTHIDGFAEKVEANRLMEPYDKL